MREILDLLGWKSHREEPTGERGNCPIHSKGDHRSRSFAVDGQRWFCQRCKLGGGPLQLYALATGRATHGHGFYEAVKELFRRLGRPLPYLPRTRVPRTREEES